MERGTDIIGEDAIATVDDFIGKHHAAAIPALIGACVMWAVKHGAADLIQGTLASASTLGTDMAASYSRDAN